jgi:ATP-dependent helicase/nuclease subunit A
MYVPTLEGSGVRIMNLHKAKGLEARVVILADSGDRPRKSDPQLHVSRTEQGGRGYLQISRQLGPYTSEPLAEPPDWESHHAEESRFEEGERQRQLYVAATRAQELLIACVRTDGDKEVNHSSPWGGLLPYLKDAKHLKCSDGGFEPGDQKEASRRSQAIQPAVSLSEAWRACLVPSAMKAPSRGPKEQNEVHRWADLWHACLGD